MAKWDKNCDPAAIARAAGTNNSAQVLAVSLCGKCWALSTSLPRPPCLRYRARGHPRREHQAIPVQIVLPV